MQTGNAEVDARTYVLRGVDVTTVNWFTISQILFARLLRSLRSD